MPQSTAINTKSLDSTNGSTSSVASKLTHSIERPHTTDHTPKKQIRFYRYSCKITYPMDAAQVEHQFTLAHRHRNLLTQILLRGRERYWEIIRQHLHLDLESLEKQAEELSNEIATFSKQITDWKKENRTAKTHPQLATRLRYAKTKKNGIATQIKATITAAKEDPTLKAAVAQHEKGIDTQIREARNHYSGQLGLYWANYLDNERAANQARYGLKNPKYRRWTGEGKIAIQFQGGLSVKNLFRCKDKLLRLIEPDQSHITTNGKIRGQARKVRALYRVASNPKGSPRWISLDVTMHRALPQNGVLKWAHLQREKAPSAAGKSYRSITKDYDYYLCLTVEEPPPPLIHPHKVAIETGWRLFPKSLRVAVALGSDQTIQELHLSKEWIEGKQKVQSLKSIIDRETNKTAAELKNQYPDIATALDQESKIPHRQAAALLRLYDEIPALQPVIAPWRTHHLHLIRYAKGLNQRLDRQRRERYRHFVSALAKTYSICAIADFDLTTLIRTDLTKDKKPDTPNWYRSIANTSSLTRMLRERLDCRKLPSTHKTKMCHVCRQLDDWDSEISIRHQCINCQSEWDQDHNAALNLLDALLETLPTEAATSPVHQPTQPEQAKPAPKQPIPA